jgi:hypothetical protein
VREQFCLLVVKETGARCKPHCAPAAPCRKEEGSDEAQAEAQARR